MYSMEVRYEDVNCFSCSSSSRVVLEKNGIICTKSLGWGRKGTYITTIYESYCPDCGEENNGESERLIESENIYLDFIKLPAFIVFVIFVVYGDLIFKGVG